MGQTTSGLTTSRSGLSGGSGSGASNLPPLLFHNVHGDNIRISRDGATAKRVESFCKGIVFSSRPVKINERVCLKFVEISHNWSGVIRFGFTYSDPNGHRNGAGSALPKYACPDLTNKPGYWAKALPERYCTTNGTMLHYYVTANGDVHFGINGEEKGVFFGGVDCRGPLWALIDVYGNSTAIELVGQQMLNNTRNLNNNVERIMQPLSQLMIDDGHHSTSSGASTPITAVSQCQMAPLRYQQGAHCAPMLLHQTRGRNVKFIDSSTAYRTDTEFCQGYVFTGRPLQLNERIVVQILNTEPMFHGCLALGLTSCDPHQLTTSDLPDDSNFLLDRPEYWVIARDFARNLNKFDEISFCITNNGEVHISRNGATPLVVMHVDQTLKLWAFFDIYGSTQKIRVLSNRTAPSYRSQINNNNNNNNNNGQSRLCSAAAANSNSDSINSLNSQSELRRGGARPSASSLSSANATTITTTVNSSALVGCNSKATIVTAAALPPTTVAPTTSTTGTSSALLLIINPDTVTTLPLANNAASNTATTTTTIPSQLINSQINSQFQASCSSTNNTNNGILSVAAAAAATGTIISSCSTNHYVEPIIAGSGKAQYGTTSTTSTTECTICYEKQIDAVLYMCGHMCMCYECALQQWRGKGGGQCPLCRAVIKDVIRTYKS